MRGGPVIEWRDTRGNPVTVGERTITPVASSLVVRWPGGGFVWSGPAAVVVEQEEATERIPVRNLNRRVLWAMKVGTVALISVCVARNRRRGKADD